MDKTEVMEVIEEATGPTVKKIRVKSRTIDILEVEDKVEEKAEEDSSVFPLVRIKRLMQVGTDEMIRSETLKIMSRAAELFLQEFTRRSYQFTKSKGKKTVVLADAVEAVSTNENLAFIKDSGILSNFVIGSDQRGESSHNIEPSSQKPTYYNSEVQTLETEPNKPDSYSELIPKKSKFSASGDIGIDQGTQIIPIEQSTLSSRVPLNKVLYPNKRNDFESVQKGQKFNKDTDINSCNNEVIDLDMYEPSFTSDPVDSVNTQFKYHKTHYL